MQSLTSILGPVPTEIVEAAFTLCKTFLDSASTEIRNEQPTTYIRLTIKPVAIEVEDLGPATQN